MQLTWKFNYRNYANLLGIDLVGNKGLALDPSVALFVLIHGFKTGTFTGRKITDYLNSARTDFINCRRVINGMDKAQLIARYANRYL